MLTRKIVETCRRSGFQVRWARGRVMVKAPVGKCRGAAIEISTRGRGLVIRAVAKTGRESQARASLMPRIEQKVSLADLASTLRSLVVHREMVFERARDGRRGPYRLGDETWTIDAPAPRRVARKKSVTKTRKRTRR